MVIKKGQAALDFLMTYGWAIALVVIVAAALFALGVFDVSNFIGTKAPGFSEVAVQGWSYSGAVLQARLTNQVGQKINITGMSVVVGSASPVACTGTPVQLAVGETTAVGALNCTGLASQSVGTGYQAKLTINYTDMNSGYPASATGTLTGKAV